MTIRKQILTQLAVVCATCADGVYRSREAAIGRTEGTALVIRPGEETGTNIANGLRQREFAVDLEVIVRGLVPDDIADPVVDALHDAIMADPTLGGLAAKVIEDATVWDFEEADLTAGSVKVRYIVRYLTPTSSLSTSV